MKKVFATCIMVILSLFAVGCEKVIELTDEENYLVAEYAAELLLKYDKYMDLKYDGLEATPDDAIEDTTTETTELTTTETETTETESEQSTTEDIQNTSDPEILDPVDGEVEVDYQAADFNLASFVGVNNVDIKFQYAMLTKVYPSYDSSGMHIELEAPEGYKLLVLKFRLENQTNENQYIDLYSRDIGYRIIIDDSRSAKNMLTILIDDLYTYQADLGGSMIDDAVLIFQIADEVADKADNLKLKVLYNSVEAVIQLQ